MNPDDLGWVEWLLVGVTTGTIVYWPLYKAIQWFDERKRR